MKIRFPRTKFTVLSGVTALIIGGIIAYAASGRAHAGYIGLWQDSADILWNTALDTPAGTDNGDGTVTPFAGGWHYHPGFAYNVVTQGTVTVEDGCDDGTPPFVDYGTRTYFTGDAFEKTDGRVHRAVNPEAITELEVSLNIVPSAGPGRVPAAGSMGRRCGPPRNKEECKMYWWKFNFPQAFVDQGACIAWVNQRRTVTIPLPENYGLGQ